MPNATARTARQVVILDAVELIDFLHYGLIGMVGLAAVLTLWFAGYVVYRLYSD